MKLRWKKGGDSFYWDAHPPWRIGWRRRRRKKKGQRVQPLEECWRTVEKQCVQDGDDVTVVVICHDLQTSIFGPTVRLVATDRNTCVLWSKNSWFFLPRCCDRRQRNSWQSGGSRHQRKFRHSELNWLKRLFGTKTFDFTRRRRFCSTFGHHHVILGMTQSAIWRTKRWTGTTLRLYNCLRTRKWTWYAESCLR